MRLVYIICFILFSIPASASIIDYLITIDAEQQQHQSWKASSPVFRTELQTLSHLIQLNWEAPIPMIPLLINYDATLNWSSIEPYLCTFSDYYITALVPISELKRIQSLQGITRILPQVKNDLVTDISYPETNAAKTNMELGLDGSGVIIGVIDTGIDWDHPDFINPDGTSKILAMWDIADENGPGPKGIRGVGGYVYTRDDINAALRREITIPTHTDPDHGTMVSATACATGGAYHDGMFPGSLKGMAPKAELVFVNLLSPDRNSERVQTEHAFRFINNIANEYNMPAVINCSWGSEMNHHDGQDQTSQIMQNYVGNTKIGRAIVAGSGNNRNLNTHAVLNIADGQSDSVAYRMSWGKTVGYAFVSYPLDAELRFSFVDSLGNTFFEVGPDEDYQENYIFAYNITQGQFSYDYGEALFMVDNTTGVFDMYIQSTIYIKVAVDGYTPTNNFPIHFWTGRSNGYFLDHLDKSSLVISPAVAENVIAVGGYVNRNNYYDLNNTYIEHPWLTIGSLSDFSNGGPTLDGRIKPEITAPGTNVIAAFPDKRGNVADTLHLISSGTSLASPHVAGIVALMLQRAPYLTAPEIIEAIKVSGRSDSFATELPNNLWGWGKIDAYALAKTQPILRNTEVPHLDIVVKSPSFHTPVISCNANAVTNINARLLDVKGALVISTNYTIEAGLSEFTFPMNKNLPSGVYFVQVSNNFIQVNQKVVLLR